jgi:biopolymer transport protein ExbB
MLRSLVAIATVPAGVGLALTSAFAQDAAVAGPPAAQATLAALPKDLSPWGMFLAADPIVKGVMLGLFFASIVTWTVWLVKSIELMLERRRTRAAVLRLEQARGLAEVAEPMLAEKGAPAMMVRAAMAELRLSAELSGEGAETRVASRLDRIEAAAGRRMSRGTGLLATIGAVAPFVGLFGTVWGIMNSFIGISKAHTTNLAVVAPGIAEALLATAIGLVAAIPAVVIYNAFARAIGGYRASLGDASAAVLRLVSRDMERRRTPASLSRAGE